MRTVKLAAFALLFSVCPALAQDDTPSRQEIVDALLPTGLDGRRIKGARSLDGMLDGSRGIKEIDGAEVPFINLRVLFEYDSDQLSNDSMVTLRNLGEALSDESFTNSRFRIVGHTDAKGSDVYNNDLSQRRARAVTNFLTTNYNIPSERVDVAGKGKSELLPELAPEDGRNRRVEIQNITATAIN